MLRRVVSNLNLQKPHYTRDVLRHILFLESNTPHNHVVIAQIGIAVSASCETDRFKFFLPSSAVTHRIGDEIR